MRGQKRVMYLNLHFTVFQLLARRPGLAVRQVRQGGQEARRQLLRPGLM